MEACSWLGSTYGDVRNLLNSCNEESACEDAARYGGSIGDISGSCIDSFACFGLGLCNGKAGFVKDSCTGIHAYESAGSERGSIGCISQSCKADNACRLAGNGQTGVITSNLRNCCNTLRTPGICELATEQTLPDQCTRDSKVRNSFEIDCFAVIA